MPRGDHDDPLGAEHEPRNLGEDVPEEGPPVSQMATTYGSSMVTSEEHAEKIATEQADKGKGSPDGLGIPQPPAESSGQ